MYIFQQTVINPTLSADLYVPILATIGLVLSIIGFVKYRTILGVVFIIINGLLIFSGFLIYAFMLAITNIA